MSLGNEYPGGLLSSAYGKWMSLTSIDTMSWSAISWPLASQRYARRLDGNDGRLHGCESAPPLKPSVRGEHGIEQAGHDQSPPAGDVLDENAERGDAESTLAQPRRRRWE